MRVDETYRDYRIMYRRGGELSANVWPPNSGLALSDTLIATMAEGMEVLRSRVRSAIDADITRT